MNTQQQGALAWAGAVQSLMVQLQGIDATVTSLLNQNTKEGWLTVLQAMATAAQNADGSVGTADGSPNNAHPITVGAINRSANAFSNGVSTMAQLQNFFANAAVTTGDYRANVATLAY